MSSMYETIMNLPLFYGITADQVSRFVATTHLRFDKYESGETICEEGEEADELRIMLSGKARLTYSTYTGTLTVEETATPGRILGAERIFGLDTRLPFKAVATESASVMSFSKEEYLRLLKSETIYMVNYINFLAARAQRPVDIILTSGFMTITQFLSAWVRLLTDPKSEDCAIRATTADLIRLTNIDRDRLSRQLSLLEEEGVVELTGDTIRILDRRALIEGKP